jgi:hypothetical protein
MNWVRWMGRRVGAAVLLANLGVGLLSCNDTKVEPLPVAVTALDDRITLTGRVCTHKPAVADFPVKVLFLIDKSGSMCVTDPPGSQSSSQSLCQNFNAPFSDPNYKPPSNYCEPDGNAHPGRTCAIYQLLNQFAGSPNVQAALVPFETKISGAYPDDANFLPVIKNGGGANLDTWVQHINDMQGSLGQGTDYQGAFAEAYRRIADDINNTSKAQRPRTRYVVVFLTDGTPFPRCAADDALPANDYANPSNPDGIWPDSPGAGCPGDGCFCNETPEYLAMHPLGSDFATGTDRNQNYQILDLVDRIMTLRDQYNVADIRIHSVLLFNRGNIATLGPSEQQDLFGDVGTADPVTAAHDVAEHLLRKISEGHGNGTYQEFSDVTSIGLGALNYASLASPYVLKNLIVEDINARPTPKGQAVDSDGDGLPDETDSSFSAGTNKFKTDSDADGFDDYFEYTHKLKGFNPDNDPDPRGCKATPLRPNPDCACQDTDGDGLSECAEKYLGTDSTLVDSDADGVPDGLEARYGLDPAVRDAPLKDSDGDGLPDLLEIQQHSDPLVADADLQAREGYRYDIKAVDVDGGVTCYDFSVSNIRMVTTQAADNTPHGYNVFRIHFDEAPQSNVEGDYGEWREACAVAEYAPPSLRIPAGPTLKIDNTDFKNPNKITPDRFDTECVHGQ